ncbi:hypothetical protein HU200_010375 [Digitaria exilis]|uniref:non-specific serine/threonine protein kinase n=1 Tax=Digitaria exilis TaxID=1010633 RepID=A0A835KMB3_9POAL|nr:hypothetical protein HU200_010375 [Digitaria exilis]
MAWPAIIRYAIVLHLLLRPPCATGTGDRLVPGKPLSPGTTIVSEGGSFALGFFSPTNSTPSKLYLGIWYNDIPRLTVLWVANRENPAMSSPAAALSLTNTSNLVLSDAGGRVLWTTNVTGAASAPAAAVLLNTGNLVIQSPNGTTLWQSFDNPTDTFLPGMNIGINYATRAGERLVSWKGPGDPSPGSFSLGLDPDAFLQAFIWNATRPVWRSGPWTGYFVSPGYQANVIVYLTVIDTQEEIYMTYSLSAGAAYTRYVLTDTGGFELHTWNTSSSAWVFLWDWTSGPCSRYGYCGPNGYCDYSDLSSMCKCLDGFEPTSMEEWKSGVIGYRIWKTGKTSYWAKHKRQNVNDMRTSDDLGEGKQAQDFELLTVRFEDIVAATRNFSEAYKIGQGGFGKVYKAMLGGQEVAIKRLSKDSEQGTKEFTNEVILIAKLQHRNLVRLLGCSVEADEKILIYEYLSNGSLDATLFDDSRKKFLDWPKRFNIIKGVARGLLYLHQDSRLTIIHRDLKAANVLLDADMRPKIADFGMARIFNDSQQNANTHRVVGTYGYMAPEYAMEGVFSIKSDVYSFGVLLLEVVTGIRRSSAWNLWKEGKGRDLADPYIMDTCSLDEVLLCIHMALLCVQENPDDRPLMSSVVFTLENECAALPTPNDPGHYGQRPGDYGPRISDVATPSRQYLGIWYSNATVPVRTVVWVANRDAPVIVVDDLAFVNDTSTDLVLTDASGRVVWSTTANITGATSSSATAVLQNDGDLVIRRSPDGATLWRSFDYPTDTFIPGMRVGRRYRTNEEWRIVSWKNPGDPSPGSFSYGMDPSTSLQLLLWNGTRVYWRTSAWTGYLTAGMYYHGATTGTVIYVSVVDNDEEIYMTFSVSDGAPPTRYVVTDDGKFQLLSWSRNASAWATLQSWPAGQCSPYGSCGAYGYCDHTNTTQQAVSSTSTCKCLDGFEPASQEEWSRGVFSRGCRRSQPLAPCGGGGGEGDAFLAMANMKVPDKFVLLGNMSSGDECAAACRTNCSCVAYAYANLSSSSAKGNIARCLVWNGDLIDTQMIGAIWGVTAETLNLRVPAGFTGSVFLSFLAITRMTWADGHAHRDRTHVYVRRTAYSALVSLSQFSMGNKSIFLQLLMKKRDLYLCRKKGRDKNCQNFTASVCRCFGNHRHCRCMVL